MTLQTTNNSYSVADSTEKMLFAALFVISAVASAAQSFSVSSRFNDSDVRIVGGSITSIDKFPWRVQVMTTKKGQLHNCAGTIIAPTWILTAAHCFRDYNYDSDSLTIYSGSSAMVKGRRSQVARIINHKEYDFSSKTSPYDVSVIELRSPLELSQENKQVAACLRSDPSNSDINGGFTVLASGWGRTETEPYSQNLRTAELKVISNTECRKYQNLAADESQICAFDEPKDVCNGDSGSSIDIIEDGKAYAVGIVSYGPSKPCGKGTPGVYTRVSSYRKWIEDNTGPLSC